MHVLGFCLNVWKVHFPANGISLEALYRGSINSKWNCSNSLCTSIWNSYTPCDIPKLKTGRTGCLISFSADFLFKHICGIKIKPFFVLQFSAHMWHLILPRSYSDSLIFCVQPLKVYSYYTAIALLSHCTLLHRTCDDTALQCRIKVKFILTWNAVNLRWLEAESNQYISVPMQLRCIMIDLHAHEWDCWISKLLCNFKIHFPAKGFVHPNCVK